MESVKKVFKKGSKRVKRALGQEVSSDSDGSDYAGELLPYNPDLDTQLHERKRRYEETGRQRAESPTRMQTAHADQRKILKARRIINKAQEAQAAQEQASLRREAAEFTHNFEINEMIKRISEALEIDVDDNDPRIRFVIGQIVNAHGLTLHSLRLMRRSTILLSAVGDIAARTAARTGRNALRASEVVYSAGKSVLEALRAAGRLASRLPSLGAAALSYLPSLPSLSSLSSRFSSQPRSPGSFLQVQGPPELGFNQVRFSVQAPTLEEQRRQQLEMDRNLQLQFSPAPSAFGRQSLPFQSQAPPPPPPPPPPPASTSAPAVEEEDECSICMNPLIHNVVSTTCKHKFHRACVTPWLNSHCTCPMCRNTSPTPLTPAPAKRQRQGGGGGSRKTRSKRLSKSFNKCRKPRKSRKTRRRIRYSSSRRK